MRVSNIGSVVYTAQDIEKLQDEVLSLRAENDALKQRAEQSEREQVKETALVMANARRIIKRTTMSNARLFMELYGSGAGTAMRYCREILGINSDDNKTSYDDMVIHIEQRIAKIESQVAKGE